MQIKLVQVEVETAIREYVAKRLTLAAGTDVKIDLSATRGADGITATIDLVEPGASSAKVTQNVQSAEKPAQAAAPVKATQPAATATEAAEGTATAQETASPAADTQQANSDADAQSEATDAGQAADASAEAGEPAQAAPTRSLFSGLARPKNS